MRSCKSRPSLSLCLGPVSLNLIAVGCPGDWPDACFDGDGCFCIHSHSLDPLFPPGRHALISAAVPEPHGAIRRARSGNHPRQKQHQIWPCCMMLATTSLFNKASHHTSATWRSPLTRHVVPDRISPRKPPGGTQSVVVSNPPSSLRLSAPLSTGRPKTPLAARSPPLSSGSTPLSRPTTTQKLAVSQTRGNNSALPPITTSNPAAHPAT